MQQAVQAGGTASAAPPGTRQLLLIFAGWKVLLILVACASPGPGYDTSTRILLDQYGSPTSTSLVARALDSLVLRLTRWDGIYFASSSTRGHAYEQEWAFSWVLAKITSAISRVLAPPLQVSPIVGHALAGILVSHVSHLLAVLTLHRLVLHLLPTGKSPNRTTAPTKESQPAVRSSPAEIAFTTAVLHTVSPGGLFLSAPNAESTFAFFNFLGMLSYTCAVKARYGSHGPISNSLWTLAAGASFALASTIRSNGLLSGTIFTWDALQLVVDLSVMLRSPKKRMTFLVTVAAGMVLAIGFVLPQAVAYGEYCMNGNTRPWCDRIPPSIYTWVQEHYWGVGFLKYWTLNNLPLFILAGPMLACLAWTSYVALFSVDTIVPQLVSVRDDGHKVDEEGLQCFKHLLPRLALPQLILTVMATTSFHVQIINRISAGYPVWYLMLAIALYNSRSSQIGKGQKEAEAQPKPGFAESKSLQWAVRAMVVYAIVQGGLYSSFLPPA